MAQPKKQRQKCQVYSRVVGYYATTTLWNEGKKEEFKDRKEYDKCLTSVTEKS